MFQLADALWEQGDEALCTAGFTWQKCSRRDFVLTSNIFEKTLHTYLARLTGRTGCFSRAATRRLLRRLDRFRPDVIHLHNLHGWFVNLPMLFSYIRKRGIKVVWTLHDCWALTGHCPHFDMIGCEKWKTGCHHCPLYREYPRTWFDCSRAMYRKKRQWFSGVEDLTLVAPSGWLAGLVEDSFLRDYPVQVIRNGIDLEAFCPSESDFRRKYGCQDKHMVLGVAYAWDDKKGLDVFLKLAQMLDESYRIVLVGTDDAVDALLPGNILSIHRTQSRQELAQIYTAADVFVNPTRQDTYPTVNMEALACGTPVITFDTGGAPEISDDSCGVTVARDDVDTLAEEIRRICREKPFTGEMCRKRAEAFDWRGAVRAYLDLYEERNDGTAKNGI